MKYKYILGLPLLLVSACSHISPALNESNMSSAIVITGKTPFLGLNIGWGAEIAKVFDLNGNTVVERRTLFAYDDVTIPSGKYEVLVRCFINNIYGYRSYILDAEAGHKYTLECVPGRVSDDPKVILAEKKINMHNK